MIKHARVFDDGNGISIYYFDEKERWMRISGGFSKGDDLYLKKKESEEEFLNRLKEFVWKKYLKPTKKRFGKLIGS